MTMRILPCLLLALAVLLSGCGVKGDLYLPEPEPAAAMGQEDRR